MAQANQHVNARARGFAPRWRTCALVCAVALIIAACGADTTVDATTSTPLTGENDGATRPLAITEPANTPQVDRSIASVSLEDIVFDTFDGGSFTLADADPSNVERLFDAIAPIDGPDYETVAEADWLTGDDVVLGYEDPQGGAWAFPVKILNSHEIVNDELGGQPVLISYCPLCGSGVVYDRVLDGRELSFSNTSALLDNDMVMVDRETGSYWWQVAGSAVVGELTESRLVALVSQTTTLERWVSQFPDTVVLERPTSRSYDSDPFANYAAVLDGGRTPFPLRQDTLADDRLASSTPVVFATINGETLAWNPEPARAFSDVVGGVAVDVVTDGLGAIVTADGESVPTRSSFWFAAITAFPDIELSSN